MRRYSHHCPSAIAQEHIVGDPYRHLIAIEFIDNMGADKNPCLLLLRGQPFDLRLASSPLNVLTNLMFVFTGGELSNQGVLGSKDHECDAEYSVRASGEDFDFFFTNALHIKPKGYLHANAFANPVALHYFHALRPFNSDELKQLLGILGYPEEPLLQILPYHRCATAFAHSLTYNLLIGQHSLALRAPIGRRLGPISQPSLVELEEEPLRPLVVFRQTGNYLLAPIIHRAHAPQLAAHVLDITHSPGMGMDAMFDSSVLSRKSEGIETYGMENVITLHPLKASVDIGGSHCIPVADMEVAGGVREHGEGIPLGAL